MHTAAAVFPRVALYFEFSIAQPDWALLPSSAALVEKASRTGNKLTIEARSTVGVPWKGPVSVDGKPWPVGTDIVWLPSGRHTVESSSVRAPLRILDLNGDLRSAAVTVTGLTFTYESSGRAMVRFDRPLERLEIDGVGVPFQAKNNMIFLPRGQHFVAAQ